MDKNSTLILNYYLVDCEWDDWQIGECDEPCGGGFRTNQRAPRVDAQHGGDECTGASTVVESCNIHECPGKRNKKYLHPLNIYPDLQSFTFNLYRIIYNFSMKGMRQHFS